MAAYASAVTLLFPTTIRLQHTRLGILMGSVDVTNYNQTLAAITAISNHFRSSAYRVFFAGATDIGYLPEWVDGSDSIKMWTFEDTGNVPVQVANDVDTGAVDFYAIGTAR